MLCDVKEALTARWIYALTKRFPRGERGDFYMRLRFSGRRLCLPFTRCNSPFISKETF